MNQQEKDELLGNVLDGNAGVDARARLLDWLRKNPGDRGDVAEQVALDGLLGVALEADGGEDFKDRLKDRLVIEEQRNWFRKIRLSLHNNMRPLAFVLGPLLAIIAWWLTWELLERGAGGPGPLHAAWASGVLTLCAIWWVLEPIPIGATSLIPLAVFPVTGVLDEAGVANAYCNHLVVLFFSGFVLSKAMEASGTHRRLALGMVRLIGGADGRRLVLGFMMASAFISMWVANTVTVLMILPVALAVIDQSRGRRLATPLLLGIAYAAAFGGMGTPVGTPPNGIFMAQADLLLAKGIISRPFDFLDWMKVGLPLVLIMVPVTWLWLTRGNWPSYPVRIAPVGPWSKPQVRVSLVLGLTAILWTTRTNPFGGWSGLLHLPPVHDSTVGVLAIAALFLIPSGEGKGRQLLTWEQAVDVPWSILLLLGAGIAIGDAFSITGLSQALAENLHVLTGLPLLPKLALVVLGVTVVTEFSSNSATATVLMPLLAAGAAGTGMSPVLLMLSASLANSCSFMLPIATPPNAIVFAVGSFTMRQMFWEGLVLKLISVVVITLLCYFLLG